MKHPFWRERREKKKKNKSRGEELSYPICFICVFFVFAGLHEHHHRCEEEGKRQIFFTLSYCSFGGDARFHALLLMVVHELTHHQCPLLLSLF